MAARWRKMLALSAVGSLLFLPAAGAWVPSVAAAGRVFSAGSSQGGTTGNRSPFTDLGGYGWAAGAIEDLATRGIIKGTGPGTFDPSGQITRVQFAALMQRSFGLAPPTVCSAPFALCPPYRYAWFFFTDVPRSSWEYTPAMAVTPYMDYSHMPGGGYAFHPDQPVDRQDAATVLVKILAAANKITVLSSTDAQGVLAGVADASDIAPALQVYVATAIKAGLIKGFPDGSFRPGSIMTRAQVAVLLQRLENRFLVNGSSSSP